MIRMEFSGLSVIEVRNILSSRLGMRILAMVFFVRFAYSKIQALVMVENGNPGPSALLVAQRKALKAVKDLWVSEIDGSFFFLTQI